MKLKAGLTSLILGRCFASNVWNLVVIKMSYILKSWLVVATNRALVDCLPVCVHVADVLLWSQGGGKV